MLGMISMKRSFVWLLLLLPLACAAQLPTGTAMPLWPGVAPDASPLAGAEVDTQKPTDGLIAGRTVIKLTNVSVPTMTLYQPTGKKSGAAVVVFPGGGYTILAMDLEGTEVCQWLVQRGVACVLVKYQVPKSGPFPKSPQALEDAQRAMGLVRQHAAEWGIDPHRVGVLGFSAGGHLVAALSTHYEKRTYAAVDEADALPCRPDFALLIYPAFLTGPQGSFTLKQELAVTSRAPPTFLLQAENDPWHVENVLAYFAALKSAKVPAELHVYADGGHGFGLRRTAMPVTHWTDLADTWLRTIRMLR